MDQEVIQTTMSTFIPSRRFRRDHDHLFQKDSATAEPDLESYFKIGVSDDYILIRADFPITEISPGDFSKICLEMFQRNEEARRDGK